MTSGIANAPGAGMPVGYESGLAGLAFFDNFLTNFIVPVIVDARNNSVVALGLLYKNKRPVSGRYIIEPVHFGRNMAGVSAIHEEGHMPDAGSQGGYTYSLAVRDIYARAKITGALLRRARTNGGAFLTPVQHEVEGLSDDFAIKQNIMMHNDGSGRRAMVNQSSFAVTNLTVQINQDIESAASCDTPATIFLEVGMRLAVMAADGTVRASASNDAFYVRSIVDDFTITIAESIGGVAITLNTISGIADNDWLVDAARDSNMQTTKYIDTAWRAEPMGLEGIMSDVGVLDGNGISTGGQQTGASNYTVTSPTAAEAGFQGIPVNSAPSGYSYDPPSFNKAVVLDNGGSQRALDEALMQRSVSLAEKRNNARMQWIFSSYEMYDAYVGTLVGDKRYHSTVLSGGHTGGVTFNNLMWFKDRYAFGNRIKFVDPNQFSVFENEPLQPITTLGTGQWRWLTDKDSYWMSLMTSYNLYVDVRERVGAHLVDLAE